MQEGDQKADGMITMRSAIQPIGFFHRAPKGQNILAARSAIGSGPYRDRQPGQAGMRCAKDYIYQIRFNFSLPHLEDDHAKVGVCIIFKQTSADWLMRFLAWPAINDTDAVS